MAITRTDRAISPLLYTLEYRVAAMDTDFWDTNANALDPASEHYHLASTACSIQARVDFRVPTFQRGVQWRWSNLEECLGSSSPLLGEVIFGIEQQRPQETQLLDGLQRFAAFTALTKALAPVLFAVDGSEVTSLVSGGDYHPSLEPQLLDLQRIGGVKRGEATILHYNHAALRHHRRAVIQESYRSFSDTVRDTLKDRLTQGTPDSIKLADNLAQFYKKSMWANQYQNFSSHEELVSAFVGWNAIRVELGLADLCRASLINKGSQAGWSHSDFIEAEDRFNSLLLESGGSHKKYYGPFVTLLHEDWFEDRKFCIMPKLKQPGSSWKTVSKEFDRLEDCIEYFDGRDPTMSEQKAEYVKYLKLMGDLPFITALVYHYRLALKKQRASIESLVESDLLHKLCVAYARRFLDGAIGNTGDIASDVLRGLSLKKWLERVSPDRAGPLNSEPDSSWLELRLDNTGYQGAKVVLGAGLLPKRTVRSGKRQWGVGTFSSIFVRAPGRQKWSLDHIIPQSQMGPETPHKDSLRNLIPVLFKDNSSYSAMDADAKLKSPDQWYAKYRDASDTERAPGGVAHPLHEKIFLKQSGHTAQRLNATDGLGGKVGKERLKLLLEILKDRL
jgi:hypothetical protein